ncbi:citrate/2-methylcitrate synthase [Staphylococcus pseudintermedius]
MKKHYKSVRFVSSQNRITRRFVCKSKEGKEPVKPDSALSYAANFLYMLRGEKPTDVEVEGFNKALILHADHELNASAFTARCASVVIIRYVFRCHCCQCHH